MDSEVLRTIDEMFREKIPFNKVLGLEIESLEEDRVLVRLKSRPELVGNFVRGSLHGGVISATLDVVGGLTAMLDAMRKIEGASPSERLEVFSKLGTIDLRVDYLRPGLGEEYAATGYVLRTGNKVAVTRMELHDQSDHLIAVATGAYVIS